MYKTKYVVFPTLFSETIYSCTNNYIDLINFIVSGGFIQNIFTPNFLQEQKETIY